MPSAAAQTLCQSVPVITVALITAAVRINGSNPVRLHASNPLVNPHATIASDVSVLCSALAAGGLVVRNMPEPLFVLYLCIAMVEIPSAESPLQTNQTGVLPVSLQEAQPGQLTGAIQVW